VGTNAGNTAPHPDSRFMVFSQGDILQADDGGIYRLKNPGAAGRQWESLNGNLSLTEFYSVAWKADDNIILGGTQDVGVLLQSQQGSSEWDTLRGGDVIWVDTAERDVLTDLIYYCFPNLQPIIIEGVTTSVAKLKVAETEGMSLSQFDNTTKNYPIAPFVVNAIDPDRILIGTSYLYEGESQGDTITLLGVNGTAVNPIRPAPGAAYRPPANAKKTAHCLRRN
jgi:hypothetical protein